jgi:hypothetical protein
LRRALAITAVIILLAPETAEAGRVPASYEKDGFRPLCLIDPESDRFYRKFIRVGRGAGPLELMRAFFAERGAFFIPEGVNVYGAELEGETLYINVSPEILYFRGSYAETRMAAQIIKTALEPGGGAKRVTLLIDGELRPLAEGTLIANAGDMWYDIPGD